MDSNFCKRGQLAKFTSVNNMRRLTSAFVVHMRKKSGFLATIPYKITYLVRVVFTGRKAKEYEPNGGHSADDDDSSDY